MTATDTEIRNGPAAKAESYTEALSRRVRKAHAENPAGFGRHLTDIAVAQQQPDAAVRIFEPDREAGA